jgi:hypothetical protein
MTILEIKKESFNYLSIKKIESFTYLFIRGKGISYLDKSEHIILLCSDDSYFSEIHDYIKKYHHEYFDIKSAFTLTEQTQGKLLNLKHKINSENYLFCKKITNMNVILLEKI